MRSDVDHREILDETGSDELILFLHGIMGSPTQFAPWLSACVDAGYSVCSILLPGHGGDGRAFAKNSLPQWRAHVRARLASLAERYERIVCVGHSMGGLLALEASLNPENHIVGVFMIAPPIRINLRPWSVFERIRMLFCYNAEIYAAYERVYGVRDIPVWIYPLWIRQLLALERLMWQTKKLLPKVAVPIYVVHSELDEMVSVRSHQYLAKLAGGNRLMLKKSRHAYYPEEDAREIGAALAAFIQAVLNP